MVGGAAMKRFVAVSGGADSTALALLLWERGVEFEMCFSDTGAELPEVYAVLPRLAAIVQKPLRVVSGGSFFQWLSAQGYFLPSFRARWCTRILKVAPQDRYYAEQGAEVVAVGIRADEPLRLRGDKPGYAVEYPLADAGMDKAAVMEICRKHGLLNPVYEWRSSVSCFCCPFQRKWDWRGLRTHHPTLYAIAEEWERQSLAVGGGYSWRGGVTLEQLRQMDEEQLTLLPEVDEQPCLICTW